MVVVESTALQQHASVDAAFGGLRLPQSLHPVEVRLLQAGVQVLTVLDNQIAAELRKLLLGHQFFDAGQRQVVRNLLLRQDVYKHLCSAVLAVLARVLLLGEGLIAKGVDPHQLALSLLGAQIWSRVSYFDARQLRLLRGH